MFEQLTFASWAKERLAAGWGKAPAPAASAVALFRRLQPGSVDLLTGLEWAVSTRSEEPNKGHEALVHGGYVLAGIDPTPLDAAVRKASRETGYALAPEKLFLAGAVGPNHNRSTVRLIQEAGQTGLELTRLDLPSEPDLPYVIFLFGADVTGREPLTSTDGSIGVVRWYTTRRMVEELGASLKVDYWHKWLVVLKALAGRSEFFPAWQPGIEVFSSVTFSAPFVP